MRATIDLNVTEDVGSSFAIDGGILFKISYLTWAENQARNTVWIESITMAIMNQEIADGQHDPSRVKTENSGGNQNIGVGNHAPQHIVAFIGVVEKKDG